MKEHITDIIEISSLTIVKTFFYLLVIWFGMWQQLGVDGMVVSALSILMLIDTFLGVTESIMHRGGTSFKSLNLWVGFMSKITLLILLAALSLVGLIFKIDPHQLLLTTMMVLALAELYSILGHIYTIRTNQKTTEFDAVKELLKALRKFVLSGLKMGIKKIEGEDIKP